LASSALAKRVWFVLALALALGLGWAWGFPLAAATESVDTAAPEPVVVAVRLLAPPGTDLSGLDDLLIQVPGQPVSRPAIRRTVQLLDETGRFDNVLAYLKPVPGGVALLLQLLPRLRLSGFAFRGNTRLSEGELLKATGLKIGDEVIPERAHAAAQAIQEAYRRAGYPSAQVIWDVAQGPTQARLEFSVDEGPPLRARHIEISGHLGFLLDRVQGALDLEPGMVVDMDKVDQGLARVTQLYRKARRFAAKVGPASVARLTGDLADVRIPIESGPVFRFAFQGNRSFPDRSLREALEYEGEESLDDQVLLRMVEKLTDFYRRQGFLLCTVTVSTRKASDQVVETFAIEEDRPYRVVDLRLEGMQALDRAQLLQEFRDTVHGNQGEPFFGTPESADIDALGPSGRPMVPAPPSFKPDPDSYLAEVYAQAIARLAEHYREDGYWSVRVDAPKLDIDLRRHQIAVEVDVHEGPQVRLAGVDFSGETPLSQGELLQLTGLKVSEPLPRSAADRSRKALLKGLAHKSLPFAHIEVEQQLDPAGTEARLRFQIHEGPAVRIGRILFRGNLHTRDGFLRQNLGLSSGQPYDPDALQRSQQGLQQLGVFDQVRITLLEPDAPDAVKDLLVTLHEREPEEIVWGPGFSIIEGPRASIEYTDVNLFGRAIRFQTTLKLNYFPYSYLALSQPTGNLVLDGLPPAQTLTGKDNFFGFGGRFDAILTDPRVFKLGAAQGILRQEVLIEQVDRPYYAFSRAALIPSLSLVFNHRLTLGLQDDVEYDRITTYWANLDQVFSRLSFADLTNLRFSNGQGVTNSLGPSVGYDGRDDPINPHRGFAAILKGAWVYGLFNPSGSSALQSLPGEATPTPTAANGTLPIDFLSATGSLSGYLPVGPVVLALSLRGGRIFPIQSFVVPTQRFFLGGPDSNRGFPIDMQLPNDVRLGLHRDVALCGQSATGASCSTAGQLLRGGAELPSPGGEVFENLRGEIRFPVYAKLIDAAVFFDAGNLWSDPTRFDLFALRPAAGAGLRVPTPIGPAAFDLGFNLAPDSVVNESLYQLFLSIGVF